MLLYNLLSRYATLFGLGRTLFSPFHLKLWPNGPAREPDVFFLANEHLRRWTRTRIVGGVDLAAEVLSDDSVERDRIDKRRDFARAGIREFLLIDPRPKSFSFQLLRLDEHHIYQEVEPDVEGRVHFNTLPGF